MLRRGEFAHTWAMSSVSLSQTFSAHRMTLDFGAERAATIFPNALPCPARRSLPISQRLIDNSQRPKAEVLIQQSRQPRALRLVSEPVCRNVQAFVGVRLCTRGSELPRRAGARRPPRELADRPETSANAAPSCFLPPVLVIGGAAQLGPVSSFDERGRARLCTFLAHFAEHAARHVIC